MTDCRLTQKVSAYHDRELPELEAREMEAHIPHCRECTAALEEMARLSSLIESASPAAIPRAVLARLRERPERNGLADLLPVARFVTAAATVFLVASLSLSALSERTGSATSSANQDWVEIASVREMDTDQFDEPYVDLAQIVAPENSERTVE